MSDETTTRAARAARNQALYREVNERVKEVNEAFDALSQVGEWICECARPECSDTIVLSHEEYELVRTFDEGTGFFVKPDEAHVIPEVEKVVERHERYWVVQKIGVAGELAKRKNPRATTSIGEE
jgi:hypothetical protein